MHHKIKVSIVIPVYNVAPYVAECIQSVMNQTWKGALECILVDDYGTEWLVQLTNGKEVPVYKDEVFIV